jgi:type II secretory pathway component PulC
MDDISGIAAEVMQGKSKEEKEVAAGRVIDNYCSQQSHMETSERKMCYNLESLRQTAAWAVSVKMTVPRICKKLAKENPDICILATVVKQQALDRQKYHLSERYGAYSLYYSFSISKP